MDGQMVEVIQAYGHENIKAKHRKTFEITKESSLTERGDCIIAVRADKAAHDLSSSFKALAAKDEAIITIMLKAGSLTEVVSGRGSSLLTFSDKKSLVARRSRYVCGRTIMISADKASADLNKEFVKAMKNPKQKMEAVIIVKMLSHG